MKAYSLYRFYLLILMVLAAGCAEDEVTTGRTLPAVEPEKAIQVGCYYIPRNHEDSNALPELIAKGTSRFPEQFQPKQPINTKLARNGVYERHGNLAAKHGVDAFIVHWYCNNNGPYKDDVHKLLLERRKLRTAIRYALIWKNDHEGNRGADFMTGAGFRKVIDHLVEDHFKRPNYWKVDDGKIYFSIYDLKQYVAGFEDMELAKRSLRMLRNRTSAAGFNGLYLVGTTYGLTPEEAIEYRVGLELDAITHYNWSHTDLLTERPGTDYTKVSEAYFAALTAGEGVYGDGYAVSVTMGWDPAPLWSEGDEWKTATEYPYGPVLTGNNGARFAKALGLAKEHAKQHGPPFVLLNAWNDWLHGSYLEPEAMFKQSYIEGIKYEFIDKEDVDLYHLNRYRMNNR